MNFIEATKLMIAGNLAIREKWGNTFYLAILRGQKYIWHIENASLTPTITANVYTPSSDDILANDWVIKS